MNIVKYTTLNVLVNIYKPPDDTNDDIDNMKKKNIEKHLTREESMLCARYVRGLFDARNMRAHRRISRINSASLLSFSRSLARRGIQSPINPRGNIAEFLHASISTRGCISPNGAKDKVIPFSRLARD